MSYDKKNVRGKIKIVLIDRIGHAISFEQEYRREISAIELAPTLDWMESFYH